MRRCPVDDFTLRPETYEDVEIDRCPHCRGVWLDAGELETVQVNQDSDFRGVPTSSFDSVNAAVEMAKSASEGPRGCLVCEEPLVKKEYFSSSQIMIDACPKGHGMWLDSGELTRLQMFYENEIDTANFFANMDKDIGGFGAKVLSLLKAFKSA